MGSLRVYRRVRLSSAVAVVFACAAAAAGASAALDFSDDERTILADVIDGDGQLDAAALYVLLGRAARMPDEVWSPQSVSAANLLAEADAYRARPVRVDLRVYRVSRWAAAEQTATRWWSPADVWRVDCLGEPSEVPLRVYLTGPPARFAAGEYPNGPRAAVTGLFYKLARLSKDAPAPGESPTRLYPILVARNLVTPGGSAVWDRWPTSVWVVAAGVAVGAAAFIYLKRRAVRPRPANSPHGVNGHDKAATGESSDAVDDELIAQLQQYRNARSEETDA